MSAVICPEAGSAGVRRVDMAGLDPVDGSSGLAEIRPAGSIRQTALLCSPARLPTPLSGPAGP